MATADIPNFDDAPSKTIVITIDIYDNGYLVIMPAPDEPTDIRRRVYASRWDAGQFIYDSLPEPEHP